MNPQDSFQTETRLAFYRRRMLFLAPFLLVFAISCGELEKPKTEDFYSKTDPPPKQEFRWTNGGLPKSFDPAEAAAPPETDIVRAVYEGLTDTESKTLNAIPSIAVTWAASEDSRTWTFKLRRDAKWSNGKLVTAKDFVRSWARLAEMGDSVTHHELLKNIVGMRVLQDKHVHKDQDVFSMSTTQQPPIAEATEQVVEQASESTNDSSLNTDDPEPTRENKQDDSKPTGASDREIRKLGVKAVNDFELEVKLIQPDKEFPKLVAHPVFRPVYANGKEFSKDKLNPKAITNGAFRISSVTKGGITLKKSDSYWNRTKVKLEKVRFVPTKDADSALEAYRNGRVDAVTNAQFEPLALKLLTPYDDFKRITHSALNLYEFNRQKAPFNDRRVREALAISIERKRLTEDEMDGATKPANTYLPFQSSGRPTTFALNSKKAKDLLEKAGFPNGEDFPKVRLVINRNNIQQRIAKSVAKMWEKELNIETEIVVKELSEIEDAKREGDFDILRRGVVLPTSDETANMLAIFKPTRVKGKPTADKRRNDAKHSSDKPGKSNTDLSESQDPPKDETENEELVIDLGVEQYILTEDEALIEVPGIPLYFPTSYSLVKPYVRGFEMNTLDAPSLKEIEIDNDWQPDDAKSES